MPDSDESFADRFWRELSDLIKQRSDARQPVPTKEEKITLLNRLHEEAIRASLAAVPKAPKAPRAKPTPKAAHDEAFLAMLEASDVYKGLDIRRELGKAQMWGMTAKQEITQRRFTNWLNRALERAGIQVSGIGQTSFSAPKPQGIPEPPNWREWAAANMTEPSHSTRPWASFERAAQEYIAKEVSKLQPA